MDRLGEYGVYSFIPVEKKWRVRRAAHKPKGKVTTLPDGRLGYWTEKTILPGYVFAKFYGIPRWYVIRTLPHISGVLGYNGAPFMMGFKDVRSLHSLRLRSEQQNAEAEKKPEEITFAKDEVVRIENHSALDGFIREIEEVDPERRVAFLKDLNLMGRRVPVPFSMLAKI